MRNSEDWTSGATSGTSSLKDVPGVHNTDISIKQWSDLQTVPK